MSLSFVGDTPTIIVTIKDQDGAVVNVSGASSKQIHLKSPNGSIFPKAATFTTSGTDGKIQTTLASTDLNKPGAWSYYPVVAGVSGFAGRGTAITQQVAGN